MPAKFCRPHLRPRILSVVLTTAISVVALAILCSG
jgi:hypothetical protein